MAEAKRTTTTHSAKCRSPQANPADPAYWTATEAITFLAFGEPLKLEMLNAERDARWRRWQQFGWAGDYDPPWLPLLEARAVPRENDTGPFYPVDWTNPSAAPHGPFVARTIRAGIRQEQERLVTFPEVAALLREALAEERRQAALLNNATAALVKAVAMNEFAMLGISDADPNGRRLLFRPTYSRAPTRSAMTV